jgi:two-component system, LuxR family, response regulator FixJ
MTISPSYAQRTIIVLDRDQALCQALRLVSASLEVEFFRLGSDFFRLGDPHRPGCLFFDPRTPGCDGLGLLGQLAERNFHLPVIVVSAKPDVATVVRAMKAGALDFLEKPCVGPRLADALDTALQWDADNRPRLALNARVKRRLERLVSSEYEVLVLLVRGMSNKAAAAELSVSVRTIEVRRASVMKKMRAASLAELVRLTSPAIGLEPRPPARIAEVGSC